MEDIKVSVICITYNQAEYIKDAINSFLMQKTNFSYEIIIHDDASTDGTIEVLKYYEKKYPSKVRIVYEEENQYSKHFAKEMISGRISISCKSNLITWNNIMTVWRIFIVDGKLKKIKVLFTIRIQYQMYAQNTIWRTL